MLTVCCFLWHDPMAKCREIYTYGAQHVLRLRAMVNRHLSVPHRFVVVTDIEYGIDLEDLIGAGTCRVPYDRSQHIPGTRFGKLQLFRHDGGGIAQPGERVLYLDLDTVIVRSLDPLVDRDEDLVLWRNPNFGGKRRARYNSSIILHTAGSRPELWDDFRGRATWQMLQGHVGGTDQAWISHRCSKAEAHWTDGDGVYGAGRLLDIVPGVQTVLPENARVVFFPGSREPSMPAVQKLHPWISEHYR